jgi:hypothetical protein
MTLVSLQVTLAGFEQAGRLFWSGSRSCRDAALSHLPSVRVQASTPSEMIKLPRSKLN